MVLDEFFLEDVMLTGERLDKICKQFKGKVCTFKYLHSSGCPVQSPGVNLNEDWYSTELIAGSITIKRPFLNLEYISIELAQSNMPESPKGYVIEIKARNRKRYEKYKTGVETILNEL